MWNKSAEDSIRFRLFQVASLVVGVILIFGVVTGHQKSVGLSEEALLEEVRKRLFKEGFDAAVLYLESWRDASWGQELLLFFLFNLVWEPYLVSAGIKPSEVAIKWEPVLIGGGKTCYLPRVEVHGGFPVPLQVEVDPVKRFLLWYGGLRGPTYIWVASGSKPERALNAAKHAGIRLDRKITILLSYPFQWYKGDEKEAWDAGVVEMKRLAQELNELGLSVEVIDITTMSAEEAVATVQASLVEEGTQVLGFFHRVDENAFEVGQNGRFGQTEVGAAAEEAQCRGIKTEDRFVVIVGCSSLLFGLNDMLVNSGLTPITFSVATEFTAESVLSSITSLFDCLKEQRRAGEKFIPADDLENVLNHLKPVRMGQIKPAGLCTLWRAGMAHWLAETG